ncbi:hypothetical protein EGJ52_22835 [Pseudomonas luteola]|uniref:hypothetical protein n=1 Tax=Pseudomonas luteola TaxID=47886 RepID=UPI000F797F85|nr:hypothetical protein [Pseudomonas luteola]RRW40018.1 hypothetical protein EGJ52_22835 [Pseudomonas luteola]
MDTLLSDTLHKVNHGKISKLDRTRHSQAYRTQRWLWLSESAQQGCRTARLRQLLTEQAEEVAIVKMAAVG